MSRQTTTRTDVEAPADDGAIRSFSVDIPQEDLDDLRRRLAATRLPEKETVEDQSQGVQLATMQELVRYWGTDYDLRRFETRLNAVPQFMTEIDGLDIHFIHVRSPHENALPLIITHGWPGSVIEMLKVIGPLTDPTAHGGSAEDAFDVVVPSIPGYGFSGRPATTGWDPAHIARAWAVLMKRLGYTRFVAQGGDWGASITDLMGAQAPPGLLGIHSNMPGTVAPDVSKALATGAPAPDGSVGRRTTRVRPAELPLHEGHRLRDRDGSCARRRCTGSRIRPSPSPPGCSTTTRRATRTSHAPSTATPSATSRATRSSTTSPSPG